MVAAWWPGLSNSRSQLHAFYPPVSATRNAPFAACRSAIIFGVAAGKVRLDCTVPSRRRRRFALVLGSDRTRMLLSDRTRMPGPDRIQRQAARHAPESACPTAAFLPQLPFTARMRLRTGSS